MNSMESIYLRLERDGYPMDVAGIYLLEATPEGPLPFDDIRAIFSQRMADSPVANRMVAHAPLGIGEDRWTQADAVDFDAHVRHRVVPAPGDLPAMLATALEVSAEPLDRGRPLWQAWYLTGLADGRAALVLRLHHAVIDGMGMIALQQVLLDDEPTPVLRDREPSPVAGREYPSLARRALLEIPSRLVANTVATQRLLGRLAATVPQLVASSAQLLTGAADQGGARAGSPGAASIRLPGYLPSLTDAPPVTLFNQHVSDPLKSMAVTTLPFEQVQSVRRIVPGATVNDVLLALVTGAMRDYLAAQGDLPDGPIRTTCPVNVRTGGGGAQGNHITTMWVELPVHLGDPIDRLAAVRTSSAAAKEDLPRSTAEWESLADIGDLLLPGIVTAAMAFAGTKAFGLFPPTQNLTVSTLAGPRQPLYLATRRITNTFLRGIICPPIHLFIAAITYDQDVNVTITTVRQLCPNPQALADGLRVELDRLLAAVPRSDA
ncbi:MAG: wax ester/triacylglycerol synthase family O-acyltransferase [Intrasporangium sp.]|uniref:wax ester/triacylglycerol synthase family O-acyltransferase n=1 Tax=Intrasporangium sp. TaxID=1925024 RepID=UPI002649D5D5|nr:wax ester/triacylglycerol synthase family O-acyltransferase [Intrasporangium sp.]MDN5797838.1 wax ester/triacylglycerol synthase family O-acyltransferase [Intrasporangium sp.]